MTRLCPTWRWHSAPQSLEKHPGRIHQQQGLTQLRIAETEKYAHVTFFFNGGVETEFPGEDRVLIHSLEGGHL